MVWRGALPPGRVAPFCAGVATEPDSLPETMSGGMSCACLTACTISATRDAVLRTVTSSSANSCTACRQIALQRAAVCITTHRAILHL